MEHNTPTETACIMEPETVYVKMELEEMYVETEPIEVLLKTEPRGECVATEPGEVCVTTEPREACVITEPGEVCMNTEPREVCVKTEQVEAGEVCVKTEPGEAVKERECDDDAGCSGVSAAAAQLGLYTDHEVKDELVLGPEEWHRPKVLPVQGIGAKSKVKSLKKKTIRILTTKRDIVPKKKYSPEQMGWAIDAVRRGSSINDAAQRFNVPRATLHNKISGKSPKECSMGPGTVLSNIEEDILEVWIKDMADKHIPVTKDTILDSVQRMIIEKKQNTPFTKNRPGKKWYSAFLKRHPEIAERTAQNVCKVRDNVTEDEIEKWFSEVESDLKKRGLSHVLEHPERIFNTDESAFFLNPKPGRVLAKKGQKSVYSSSGDEKEKLAVLITGNAAGSLAPTMVVYNYTRIPSAISATYPKDWGIGRSESGWMCSGTFYEYVTNVFNPWVIKENIEKPVLLFLDGHSSHLTLHLANFCSQNGIEVVALNPHSTHILQPMDVAVFRPLKLSWREEVRTWKMQNLGQVLEKEDFAPVFKTALEKITVATVKSGFRASGLYPFGPEYVNISSKIKAGTKKNNDSLHESEFLKKLEDKIVTTFTSEKLKLFKDLYYKSRNELKNLLPSEDTSLYLIWANSQLPIDELALADVLPTSLTTCKSNPLTQTNNDNSSLDEREINACMSCISTVSHHEDLQINPVNSNGPNESNLDSSEENDEASAKINEPNVSHQENLNTDENTDAAISNYTIPSPFKRSSFWPETEELRNNKRKMKEKNPFTITSPAYSSTTKEE